MRSTEHFWVKRMAGDLMYDVAGVTDVYNQLRVKQEQPTEQAQQQAVGT
jgi:hypothetical protein